MLVELSMVAVNHGEALHEGVHAVAHAVLCVLGCFNFVKHGSGTLSNTDLGLSCDLRRMPVSRGPSMNMSDSCSHD